MKSLTPYLTKQVPRVAGLMTLMISSFASVSHGLPNPGMEIDPERTALVITDPQNDFLSPDGATWGVVGTSVTENNTVANIEALLKAAKETGVHLAALLLPHGSRLEV